MYNVIAKIMNHLKIFKSNSLNIKSISKEHEIAFFECYFSDYDWEPTESLEQLKEKIYKSIDKYKNEFLEKHANEKYLAWIDSLNLDTAKYDPIVYDLTRHDIKYNSVSFNETDGNNGCFSRIVSKDENASFVKRIDYIKLGLDRMIDIFKSDIDYFCEVIADDYNHVLQLISKCKEKFIYLVCEEYSISYNSPTIIKLADFNVWEYGHKRDNILIIEKE